MARRSRLLTVALIGGVVVAIAAVGFALSWIGSSSPGPEWVRAASLSQLEREGVVYVAAARAYVVAADARAPIALYARSPHRGMPISYCESSGWFEDRAHGSRFDGLGRYVLGPAPRGLDRFEVRVANEEVWVDPAVILIGPPRGEPTDSPSGRFCPTD